MLTYSEIRGGEGAKRLLEKTLFWSANMRSTMSMVFKNLFTQILSKLLLAASTTLPMMSIIGKESRDIRSMPWYVRL